MAGKRRNRTMGATLAGVLLSAALGITGSTAAPRQTGCTEPYAPAAFARAYPEQESLPQVAGTDVVEVPPFPDTPDPSRTYTAADGTLQGLVLGDLDDDGLDETVVVDGTEPTHAWLVPGTTPAGAHDPAVVGIEVPFAPVAAIDDRDGDGTLEVLVYAPESTVVLSGADVLDVGAGGDATSVTPLVEAPGELVALASIGTGPTTVITAERTEDGPSPGGALLHLTTEAGTESFTTRPHPFVTNYTSLVAVPRVLVDGDVVHMMLVQTDRSGAMAYLWRVDDPCAALVVVPGSTSSTAPAPPVAPPPAAAAPASAVAARPGYTG